MRKAALPGKSQSHQGIRRKTVSSCHLTAGRDVWMCARGVGEANTDAVIASRLPVLILPGFLSSDTTVPGSQYYELAENLRACGHARVGAPRAASMGGTMR